MATTRRRSSSTRRYSLLTISSRWRSLPRTPHVSSANRAATSKSTHRNPENGSLASKRERGSLSPRLSSLTVLLLVRSRRDGTLDDTAFLRISLPRPTGKLGACKNGNMLTTRTALWALVCTMEALINSGVTDPYELYKHIHPSEVGTSLGSGMGGMQSLSAMFKDRREEKDVQKDILQET